MSAGCTGTQLAGEDCWAGQCKHRPAQAACLAPAASPQTLSAAATLAPLQRSRGMMQRSHITGHGVAVNALQAHRLPLGPCKLPCP
jgi:hypothetical protein